MPTNAQAGMKSETAYGTAVTVTKFQEFFSENIVAEYDRTESASLRTGNFMQRSDRWMPNFRGASGPYEFEVMTKSFAFWLGHMLGGTVTTSAVVDSCYTHTASVGTLSGWYFTFQSNRQLNIAAGTDQAFTYEGGKVKSWELSCDVDGVLTASLDLDFENVSTGTALASASYPASMELFPWTGASYTISGTAVPVKSFKVSADNALNVDRRYQRGSGIKLEPLSEGYREATFELECDFDSLVQYNRIASATPGGAVASIVATYTAPTLAGTATYPKVTVTLPACRFDGTNPGVDSMGPLMQTLSGKVLYDGTNAPVTIAIVSTETTP